MQSASAARAYRDRQLAADRHRPSADRCRSGAICRQCGVSARNGVRDRGMNPVRNSSIPSSAISGASGVHRPSADSASTRCTLVSSVWRRAQNSSRGRRRIHRGTRRTRRRGRPRSRVSRSFTAPSQNQSIVSPRVRAAGPSESPGTSPSLVASLATAAVAHRCTSPTCSTRSLTVQPGHVGTGASSPASSAAAANSFASDASTARVAVQCRESPGHSVTAVSCYSRHVPATVRA